MFLNARAYSCCEMGCKISRHTDRREAMNAGVVTWVTTCYNPLKVKKALLDV